MSIAVIYGGTRADGNTEILTNQVLQGLTADKIYLRDYNIKPVEDRRHLPEEFQRMNDEYDTIIDQMLTHDILVFSTPIYWFGMSGIMKNFIDRWSQTMREPNYLDFKNRMSKKQAYVITVGGDKPYLKGLPLIQQFQYIFDFVTLPFEGYLLGKGNKPKDIYEDKKALFAAEQLQKKLKAHFQGEN